MLFHSGKDRQQAKAMPRRVLLRHARDKPKLVFRSFAPVGTAGLPGQQPQSQRSAGIAGRHGGIPGLLGADNQLLALPAVQIQPAADHVRKILQHGLRKLFSPPKILVLLRAPVKLHQGQQIVGKIV